MRYECIGLGILGRRGFSLPGLPVDTHPFYETFWFFSVNTQPDWLCLGFEFEHLLFHQGKEGVQLLLFCDIFITFSKSALKAVPVALASKGGTNSPYFTSTGL